MTKPLFRIYNEAGVNVIDLSFPETLDTVEFDLLSEEILNRLAAHAREKWVVDLRDITFLNSAGLGLLVNVRHRIRREGGQLALCSLSPRVYEVFHACSMERLFTLKRNLAEAVAMLR